jgi:hypothetical protein
MFSIHLLTFKKEDPLGTQWCKNLCKNQIFTVFVSFHWRHAFLVKKRPIVSKDVLFTPENPTDIQNYLSTLDKYLFILNSQLSEGDLMIVSSVCGNPIPYVFRSI